jgi:hypothetical protein
MASAKRCLLLYRPFGIQITVLDTFACLAVYYNSTHMVETSL